MARRYTTTWIIYCSMDGEFALLRWISSMKKLYSCCRSKGSPDLHLTAIRNGTSSEIQYQYYSRFTPHSRTRTQTHLHTYRRGFSSFSAMLSTNISFGFSFKWITSGRQFCQEWKSFVGRVRLSPFSFHSRPCVLYVQSVFFTSIVVHVFPCVSSTRVRVTVRHFPFLLEKMFKTLFIHKPTFGMREGKTKEYEK